MYKCLNPGAIRVSAHSVRDGIAAAKAGGFDGLEFSAAQVTELVQHEGADAIRALFRSAGVRPGAFGLPVDWRNDEAKFQTDLDYLPERAKAAAAIGCTRTSTWVLPGSNSLPTEENRRFHIERFQPIAQVLAEHGISLGLEFIGPKTLRDSLKYPFVYRMEDMLELGAEIGPNVGLLLDCWHWYTSGGTLADLRALRAEQVVYVHVNDAPKGIAVDEQQDNVRCLPGETGVIDIAGFLKAVQHIGYDGPVTPEPFKKELADCDSDGERLHIVGRAMDQIFASAGLA